MIVLDARSHAKYLNFPNAYTVLLPEKAAGERRFPLILCLHDLGKDRWQCMRELCLEEIVEKSGVALVLPDGRRSCFLNMAHGPRWSDYLIRELAVQLCHTFPLKSESVGVLGVGAGALGALALARQGIPCALVEPELRDVVAFDSLRWPREMEWRSVMEGQEAKWQPPYWQQTEGTMVGSSAALNRAEELLGLSHWKKFCCEDDSKERWETALAELACYMRTERT